MLTITLSFLPMDEAEIMQCLSLKLLRNEWEGVAVFLGEDINPVIFTRSLKCLKRNTADAIKQQMCARECWRC